jgi:hypothetical protein
MKFAIWFLGLALGFIATDIDVVLACERRGEYVTHLGLGSKLKCEVLK